MERELARLSLEQAGPDFWKNPDAAARMLREAGEKIKVLGEWREFERRAGELKEIEELALELGGGRRPGSAFIVAGLVLIALSP